VAAIGAVGLALVPVMASSYWLRLANNVGIMLMLTLGLDFIWGRAGQLSFAQPAFFCIGAYTSALLAMTANMNVFLAMLLAVLAAVGVALLIGWPALRLKTHYFALATFGMAEIARSVAVNWKAVTRGTDGITQIPAPGFGSAMLSKEWHFYYLLIAVSIVLTIAYWRVLASTYGRAFTAVRQGELAAELVGVNLTRAKLLAFGLSAAYAGLAGAMYAHLFSVISPDVFSFDNISVPILVSLFVGGSGSAGGALIGSAVVVLLPEVLRATGQWYLAVYGVGILLLMAYMPEGISARVSRAWRERRDGKAVAPTEARRPAAGWSGRANDDATVAELRIEGLTKWFGGVLAVDDVSFSVRPGTITSIIGPNGAGKTTVLNLLTGVYRPDGGSVRFGTRQLVGERPHAVAATGILRTFQNVRVWKDLSVVENVMVSLHPSELSAFPGVLCSTAAARAFEHTARIRADAALDFVGLGDLRNSSADSLPYGHLRLLELARCLVASPKVILLDEPAAGLTQHEGYLLRERLKAVRALGIAIVLIEHNMYFVMSISDSVIVMTSGRKLAEGSPEDIQKNDAVVEAYLGEEVDLARR
jgi:branched-chain amino acid transport system permease protein